MPIDMNYKVHRLKKISDLVAIRDKDPARFDRYLNNVYSRLFALEPGGTIDIELSVVEASRPIFIKVACLAIHEGYPFEFSEDYSVIRKMVDAPKKIPGRIREKESETET